MAKTTKSTPAAEEEREYLAYRAEENYSRIIVTYAVMSVIVSLASLLVIVLHC